MRQEAGDQTFGQRSRAKVGQTHCTPHEPGRRVAGRAMRKEGGGGVVQYARRTWKMERASWCSLLSGSLGCGPAAAAAAAAPPSACAAAPCAWRAKSSSYCSARPCAPHDTRGHTQRGSLPGCRTPPPGSLPPMATHRRARPLPCCAARHRAPLRPAYLGGLAVVELELLPLDLRRRRRHAHHVVEAVLGDAPLDHGLELLHGLLRRLGGRPHCTQAHARQQHAQQRQAAGAARVRPSRHPAAPAKTQLWRSPCHHRTCRHGPLSDEPPRHHRMPWCPCTRGLTAHQTTRSPHPWSQSPGPPRARC